MTRKNELSQTGMFTRMANFAQYLNIVRIGSFCGMCGMRFNVMTLKLFSRFTFLTFTSFFNNIFNQFLALKCSARRSIIPKWMFFFRHFFAPCFCHAGYRAIFACSSSSKAYLKIFSAFFTRFINKYLRLSGFDFLRTFFRTGVGFATIVCFKNLKFFCASGASKSYFSSALYLSNGVSHV